VMMSMNSANFGPFYFTGAVTFEDGKYVPEKSIPAAVKGAEITDEGITGGQIDIDADYISGIYVYNETGANTKISGVTINSSGMGGNDFGTNGGWGTVISVSGSATADIDGVKVTTDGPLHDGIWAGGNSVVNVTNTVVSAKENAAEFNFAPYQYDTFVITDNQELTEEEIAEKGVVFSHAESYDGMFGSGTKYYYSNPNATCNWSAPMLQCVPMALGLHGSMRAAICYGNATLSFTDSLVVSDIWAVISTDSGSGTLNATDTVAAIGEIVPADSEAANGVVKVNGEDYGVKFYDTTEGTGYVTYCDGFDDNFYGCKFVAPDYIAILTGGTFDFTESETQRGYGASDRIGFMSHGNAYTAVLSHSDFEVSDALYTVMSKGAVDITLDDVNVNIYGQNPWSGVLFQFMDTDDTGTDANDMEMDILDLTFEEYSKNASEKDGTTKTVTIANSKLAGDIFNSTGSSNNAHTSDAYDGTTNVLSTWNASLVNVTLDNATLDGVVSTSYGYHVDEEGKQIEGMMFFNKTGEPMEGTAENTYDFHLGRRIMNTPAYNGIGQINLTLKNGAVWNVAGEGILNSLTVEEGCSVYGAVTENADGTITVVPSEEVLPAGVYGTFSELEYVEEASGSGESEGESAEDAAPAEGESEGGESGDAPAGGDSADAPAQGGESGDAPAAPEAEVSKWDAYVEYLAQIIEIDPSFELYEQMKQEVKEIKQEDYHGMEDGTLFGALAFCYGAVPFEEYEIGMPLPDVTQAQGIGG
ncbi:MAG: hypothetical protein HUJ76_07735, partial [Parasporobacterium sp.]|nr:hypothetical protein [Parasporobacterium sp.]